MPACSLLFAGNDVIDAAPTDPIDASSPDADTSCQAECVGVCADEICFLDGTAAFVSGENGNDNENCSMNEPCASLAHALSIVRLDTSPTVVVVEAHTFTESLEVLNAPNALLLYGNGSTIAPDASQTRGGLVVTNSVLNVIGMTFDGSEQSAEYSLVLAQTNSTLHLRDVVVRSASGNGISYEEALGSAQSVVVEQSQMHGIFVRDSAFLLQRGRVQNNMRSGIRALQSSIGPTANLTVEASVVTENVDDGIQITNYPFSIRNSFVAKNMDDGISFGLENITFGTIKLDLSTIANNGAFGVRCGPTVDGPSFLVRGNIVADNIAGQTDCAGTQFVFNQSVVANYDRGLMNNIVQIDFVGSGDYRQQPSSEGIDWSGVRNLDEVADEDADGKPRSLGLGVDIGAFEADAL